MRARAEGMKEECVPGAREVRRGEERKKRKGERKETQAQKSAFVTADSELQ